MSRKTIVILIHGIRTAAWWQGPMASIIEDETDAMVIPLKYGYFDLLRFWCPFSVCRQGPIERLRKQIEGIREQYRDCRLVVLAHSYGTYALSRILLENAHFKFDSVILCGSIIPETFDWSRVGDQILSANKRDAIINECGIRDYWPVVARSASWGYGASGTFGFGSFNVRDRYHPVSHSGYFTTEFVRQYWVPAVAGQPIDFSKTDRQGSGTPLWFGIFHIPFRWLIATGVPIVLVVAALVTTGELCLGRGKEVFHGICMDSEEADGRKEIAQKITNLSRKINATYHEKESLINQMREFMRDPTTEAWRHIVSAATTLRDSVGASLRGIDTYNSDLVQRGDDVVLIANGITILIEKKYWNAFKTVKEDFVSREGILSKIAMDSAAAPSPESVMDWRKQLDELQTNLKVALDDVLRLVEQPKRKWWML